MKHQYQKDKKPYRGNFSNARGIENLKGLFADRGGAKALHQLGELRRQSKTHKLYGRTNFPEFEESLGAIYPANEDGITHVNISGEAKTDIGRILGISDDLPYYDEVLGVDVRSLYAFYLYVMGGAKDHDSLLLGYDWRSNTEKKERQSRLPNNFVLYAHAYWQKIKFYPALSQLLMSLKLPIDCYRVVKGTGSYVRSVTNAAHAHALRLIQQALIEDKEPNFVTLLDKSTQEEINRTCLMEHEVIEATNKIITDLLASGVEYFQANDMAHGTKLQNEVSFAKSPVQNKPKSTNLNHAIPQFAPTPGAQVPEVQTQEPEQKASEEGIELQESSAQTEVQLQDGTTVMDIGTPAAQ